VTSPFCGAEQDRILRDIETHQSANRTYIEEGVQLLRLADRAHALFERQEPAEKWRLLNFLLSNCVWKNGVLTAEYRQPFDMLALAREAAGDAVGVSGAKTASFENWRPRSDLPTQLNQAADPAAGGVGIPEDAFPQV
jgi:site-specific DNA recombinase